MASVKITTKDCYYECGEQFCCSEYWTDWALYIDGVLVEEGRSDDSYEAESFAAMTALRHLGHTVDVEELERRMKIEVCSS